MGTKCELNLNNQQFYNLVTSGLGQKQQSKLWQNIQKVIMSSNLVLWKAG